MLLTFQLPTLHDKYFLLHVRKFTNKVADLKGQAVSRMKFKGTEYPVLKIKLRFTASKS